MRLYVVCEYDDYYPRHGLGNIVKIFVSEEEALLYAEELASRSTYDNVEVWWISDSEYGLIRAYDEYTLD